MSSYPLGALNWYFIFTSVFSLCMMVGYLASDCSATLAIFGYNLFGPQLSHPECGVAAVLFLRFVEAAWRASTVLAYMFAMSGLFFVLGFAPKLGVDVSRRLMLLIYLFYFVPVFLGIILAFMVTEVEPGVKYPYAINLIYLAVFSAAFALCYSKHTDAPPGGRLL